MGNKVDRDVAMAEVEAWLDGKRIQTSHREGQQEQIEILVDSIADGVIVRDAVTNELKHELIWPLDKGEVALKSLTYKPRLSDKQLQGPMKGVSPKDGDARMNAYVAAITGQTRDVISMLDSVDKRISLAVTIFFLPG